MPSFRQPDTPASALPPTAHPASHLDARIKRASGLFADENLDLLSHVLDDWFRIPGTGIRFGLDGIIGLIPGLGDIAGGLASCIMILAAWVRGVPYITIARMLVNLALDVIIGAVPFLGDMFDIAWKANRRNYALLTRHVQQPRRHTWRDWVFLLSVAIAAAVILVVPAIMLVWAADWLLHAHPMGPGSLLQFP